MANWVLLRATASGKGNLEAKELGKCLHFSFCIFFKVTKFTYLLLNLKLVSEEQ